MAAVDVSILLFLFIYNIHPMLGELNVINLYDVFNISTSLS